MTDYNTKLGKFFKLCMLMEKPSKKLAELVSNRAEEEFETILDELETSIRELYLGVDNSDRL